VCVCVQICPNAQRKPANNLTDSPEDKTQEQKQLKSIEYKRFRKKRG